MNKTKIDEAVKQVMAELSDWLLCLPLECVRDDEETANNVLDDLSAAFAHLRMQMPLWLAAGHGKDYQILLLRMLIEVERFGRVRGSSDQEMQASITALSDDIDVFADEVEDRMNGENNSGKVDVGLFTDPIDAW